VHTSGGADLVTIPGRFRHPEHRAIADQRDRGSVLILALVFMVIGAMIVLPLLSYSMAVLRANSVLSNKTQRIEAVKGGLRASLANPLDLYKTCGEGESLSSVDVNGMTVYNECRFLYAAKALAETEIRYGIVTTQVGESAPPYLAGSRYEPVDPDSATGWLADTTLDSVTGNIMLPNLPVYGTSPRSPLGSQMPEDYVPDGYDSCKVFFPGKYVDALTLDGPAFFVSGIYYFTQPVTILGGARVVVGDGTHEGCTTSQEAVFYAEPPPSGSHNVNGLGATWVLGDAARVVFDNTRTRDGSPNAQPIEFTFNQRYVAPKDLASRPSADVSIVTVNGDLERTPDLPGEGRYLEVHDPADPARPILHVPEQFIGAVADDPDTPDVNESDTVRDTGESATAAGYVPSVFTPKPRVPGSPTGVSVQTHDQTLIVRWSAPSDDGNSPIVGYVARATTNNGAIEAGTCATNGALECVITGLNPALDHKVSVEAINHWMTQQDPPRTPNPWVSTATWKPTGSSLPAPFEPPAPTVAMYRDETETDPRAAGVAHVEFVLPTPTQGSTPVSGYEIEHRQITDGDGAPVTQLWESCNGDETPDVNATVAELDPATLYCDVTGLDPTASYEFRVVAQATSTLATASPSPSPVYDRTDAGTVAAGAPDHAALDTIDPLDPYYGLLAAYVEAAWEPHADHAPPPAALPAPGPPIPVVEFNLINPDATAVINIASYVAVPQGRFVLDNPSGYDVRIGGGVLASSMAIDDSRSTCAGSAPPGCVPDAPEIVPVGLRPVEVQRKFMILSTVTTGRERSVAVVQVNQNGAYAVNSWEVQ